MSTPVNRREFLHRTSIGTASLASLASAAAAQAPAARSKEPLAIAGGKPVRTAKFPDWPVLEQNDRDAWQKVLNDRHWCRLDGNYANRFEKAYAELTGTKHCLVTANGTSALFTSLNALGVGPGDEVIVPPYTFVATINVVLLNHALPVFVDSDRMSSQIDANK